MVAVNEFVFSEYLLAIIVDEVKDVLVDISISYKGAPVEFHLKTELSATEVALLAGEARVGAPAIAVVKLQTADQLLLVDELFAFTLQKYLAPAVSPVKLRELVVTIFFAETRFANVTSVDISTKYDDALVMAVQLNVGARLEFVAALSGADNVGAARLVVNDQVVDHSLLPSALFAFTLQKYVVPGVNPVNEVELVVKAFKEFAIVEKPEL